MNERIKRLAEASGITLVLTEFTGRLAGKDFLVTDRNISEMVLEQFAKAVARECMALCEEIKDDDDKQDDPPFWIDGISECQHNIEEQFDLSSDD